MNVTRTLTLGVVGGSLAVWLAAAATSTVRDAPPRTQPKARAVEQSGDALAAEISRLHDRLRPVTSPTQTRDLFSYGRRRAPGSSSSSATVALAPAAPVVVAPPAPVLTLVGIAEDVTEHGAVRTAIVSGFGNLFFVKQDDAVTSRFRVTSIAADAVELIDTSNQTTLRLALN